MSVLSGGALFPRLASAATITSGTTEQRTLAKSIVRNSSPYKSLANLQAQIGSSFKFAEADIKVFDGRRATVTVIAPAVNNVRAVVASFQVHLVQKTLLDYQSVVYAPVVDRTQQLKVTYFYNGRIPKRNHKSIVGKDWVVTYDNRLMSLEQFKAEAEAFNAAARQAEVKLASSEEYQDCVLRQENACYEGWGNVCFGAGVSAVALGFAVGAGLGGAVAAGFMVGCYVTSTWGCPSVAQSYCADRYPPAPVKEEPYYYCSPYLR
jgi:hypothetical protein